MEEAWIFRVCDVGGQIGGNSIDNRTSSAIPSTSGPEGGGTDACPEHYVDAAVAAKFLSINRRTLMKMAREGHLPAHPLGDGARRLWRFLLSELDEWLRSRINSARRPCSPNRRNVQ